MGYRFIEVPYYLFTGIQMQRNYCTLYFAQINEWRIPIKAYEMSVIDYMKAYAR